MADGAGTHDDSAGHCAPTISLLPPANALT